MKLPPFISTHTVYSRDGQEPETSKNEPNQNTGFAKNRTKPEPKCYDSYSVLSLYEIVGTFTHFMVQFHKSLLS